jgi:hypothetical protein
VTNRIDFAHENFSFAFFRVSRHNEKNLMTPVNLGVCFGPSLLRPEVETVSSIYDIKFRNAIVELSIIHYDKMFKSKLEQKDIDEMVGSSDQEGNPVANLSNSLSSIGVTFFFSAMIKTKIFSPILVDRFTFSINCE